MTDPIQWHVNGTHGSISVQEWPNDQATHRVVLSHGYGEHGGRYQHVAEALRRNGAVVVAPDHLGHGRSDGERALILDIDDVVADLRSVIEHAQSSGPRLPLALIGHSLGSTIAARYAQLHAADLDALVLSAAVVGPWPPATQLLSFAELPEVPIDPASLSRDPAVGAAYLADELVYTGPFKRATLEAIVAGVGRIQAGPRLEMPTLWIHGEEDPLMALADARPSVEKIRGAELQEVTYAGALHEIFNETNSEEVLADVVAFLNRVLHPVPTTAAASSSAGT